MAATDTSVSTAWTLRNLVVTSIRDASDAASLALSLPCVLGPPCVRWLALHGPVAVARLLDAFVSLCAAGRADEAQRIATARCFAPAWSISSRAVLSALWIASGLPCRPALALPLHLARQVSMDPLDVLVFCCSFDMHECVRILGRHFSPARASSKVRAALAAACVNGCLGAIRALADEPYRVGHQEAVRSLALVRACEGGHAEVLRLLAREPFSLGQADARMNNCRALACAVQSGSVDTLLQLALPPFNLGRSDANSALALAFSCMNGNSHVLRALGQPPFLLTAEDARESKVLFRACSMGLEDIVRVLAEPPWCLGQQDARVNGCEALRAAALHGHARVLRLLAQPPWSLGPEDAREADNIALCGACAGGFVDAVRVLSEPPYSLGQREARSRSCAALVFAFGGGFEDLVLMLSEPPFLLGHNDAVTALAQVRVNHPKILSLLRNPPYSIEDAS
eukprot:m51a1_g10891 hypothetical protein (456) ;mRNA; r:12170-13537